jgi:hypothetical protein
MPVPILSPAARTSLLAVMTMTLMAAVATPAASQQPTPPDPILAPAESLLDECSAQADRGAIPDALATGKRAESQFRSVLARKAGEPEAMVGLARTLSQCLIPAAEFAQQGELSAEAIELLQNALELKPTHWTARFVLANIYLRSPAFLGRGPLAAKELDELLRQQGDRTTNPMYARVFEMRGKMFGRANMPDSARALYVRGSTLFPDDAALRALAASSTSASAAPPPTTASLATVQVVASATASAPPAQPVVQVTRAQVLMTPGGTADVIQAVQMQPGATHVAEGSDVYTRGGGVTETAFLVDGGRMPSLSRFEGLNGGMFGALDPFIVKSVRYSSGGFSAKHGNALSGVLEIETDGRPRERQVRAGLSMAQASATVRVPLDRKVGAWASARFANTGVILATHGRTAEFDAAPHSEELVASVIANPSATSEFRATVVAEQDDARRIVSAAGWDGPFHSAGAARAALVSSRWMPGDGAVVIRSSITGSTRTSAWDFGALSRDREERGIIARTDVEWALGLATTLRGGIEHGRFARLEDGTLPTTGAVAPGSPTRALDEVEARTTHLGGYAEAELASERTSLLVGMRADRLPGETGASLDPRVSLSTRRGAWTARIGGGLFHQGRWQSAPAIPDAATPAGAPRQARHIVAGLERDGATTLRAEIFDKQYDDYAPLGAGPQIRSARARGMDVIVHRALGSHVTGWVGYSLLDADVRLADGRAARSPYDVTHTATATATATLDRNWSIGATGRYGTGAPITPVIGATRSSDGQYTPIYGDVTSERLPAYARIDARVMRFIQAPGFLLTSFVEVINLTGRANTASVTYDASYTTRRSMHSFFASRTIVAGAEIQLR